MGSKYLVLYIVGCNNCDIRRGVVILGVSHSVAKHSGWAKMLLVL